MKTLPSRCRTNIQTDVAFLRRCSQCHLHGTDILHMEQPFPEGRKSPQIIKPGDCQCTIHAVHLLNGHAFGFQTLLQLLLCCLRLIDPNGHRLLCILIRQHPNCLVFPIFLDPLVYDPLRCGITDGQIIKRNLFYSSGNASEHAVYKPFQGSEAFFLRQTHCLVTDGRIRYTVHIF